MAIKQFKLKSKYPRRSVARDIDEGMNEAYQKSLRDKRNKRVSKFNGRYK